MTRKRVNEDRTLTRAEIQKRFRNSNELVMTFYEKITGLSRKEVKKLTSNPNIIDELVDNKQLKLWEI